MLIKKFPSILRKLKELDYVFVIVFLYQQKSAPKNRIIILPANRNVETCDNVRFAAGIDDTEEQQAGDETEDMPPLEGDADDDDASKMEEVD